MAFWRVMDRIQLEVGHVLSRSSAPGVQITEYCETASTATRPGQDRAEHQVHCGHCGDTVPFTVYSVALTRRYRLVAYGIGAFLLLVAALLYTVGIDAVVGAGSPVWALLLAGAEIVLILLAVRVLLHAAVFEHGVRSPMLWRGGAVPRDGHLAMVDPYLGRKPSARNGRVISSVHRHPPDDQRTVFGAD